LRRLLLKIEVPPPRREGVEGGHHCAVNWLFQHGTSTCLGFILMQARGQMGISDRVFYMFGDAVIGPAVGTASQQVLASQMRVCKMMPSV
jgi:hypothetical protein